MAWVWLSHSAFGPERLNSVLADAYEATYDVLAAGGAEPLVVARVKPEGLVTVLD